ncbi:tyrosine decarboxylase-like [Nymphaea colorata]|uniref:Tyrosine decarboxylase n=1 Tax=Nymphaea colorata TaxID=210225 RepID=A0A5K0W1E0_9MAGN|nr:tyrosine decarboxylase-like [Nymphaea colorata]
MAIPTSIDAKESVRLLDSQEFCQQAHRVVDFIADYYKHIEDYPVLSPVEPGYLRRQLPETFPTYPESIEKILLDVKNSIIPGLTHWQSPNFFAYFQTNASTAGFLGDMLCGGFNVVGLNWVSSPAATELETIVMDWMAQMLKLPPAFMFPTNNASHGGGGVLHGSTCEAIVCTLVAARDKVLSKVGFHNITKLLVYGSDQTHSALEKGARIVGISPQNFRSLPTSAATGYSLQPLAVQAAMADDIAKGLIPFYLCATIGTTGVGAVDPLEDLGLIAKRYGAWLHVDAAYAGSACICPEFRHHLDGVEHASSISMNLHKWFLTNMDCCCLWIKNTTTFVSALSTNPEYLRNSASECKKVIDYKDWQIALSRRFRSIKLWLVIRAYGMDKLKEHIRSDVMLAMVFEKLVKADERFEVAAPRRFALVCFRLRSDSERLRSMMNHKLLEAVNSTGKLYMTHTVAAGAYILRFAIGATLTEERHVRAAWTVIQEQARLLLTQRAQLL